MAHSWGFLNILKSLYKKRTESQNQNLMANIYKKNGDNVSPQTKIECKGQNR